MTATKLTPDQIEQVDWWLSANYDGRDPDELAAEAVVELFDCPDDTKDATALIDAVADAVEEWAR